MLQVLSYNDKCTRYLIFIVKKIVYMRLREQQKKYCVMTCFSFLLRHILKNPQIEIDGGDRRRTRISQIR